MVFTKANWSGTCALEHVYFNNTDILEYQEKEMIKIITEIWEDFVKTYPESYDGKILFLNSFECETALDNPNQCYFFLNISFIRYSTLIGLIKLRKQVQFYGTIGTQVAIFDEGEKFILVGKRKLHQYYAPGLLTLPGGMLELDDVNNPKKSLLRELHEEVEIKIKNPTIIALLTEHTKYSIIFLIKATIDQSFDRNQIFKEKEDEFEGNKLHWIEKIQLSKINSDSLMEGLTYLKDI